MAFESDSEEDDRIESTDDVEDEGIWEIVISASSLKWKRICSMSFEDNSFSRDANKMLKRIETSVFRRSPLANKVFLNHTERLPQIQTQ